MAVLDTTVLVDLLRSAKNPHYQRARKIFSELVLAGEIVCTTRLNAAEMWAGIEMKGNKPAEIALLTATLDDLVILDLQDDSAREFGRIEAQLRGIGKPAGEIDTLIAAICRVNGQCIVTRNPSHFARIPELVVKSY